jgi:hypothetical protein
MPQTPNHEKQMLASNGALLPRLQPALQITTIGAKLQAVRALLPQDQISQEQEITPIDAKLQEVLERQTRPSRPSQQILF